MRSIPALMALLTTERLLLAVLFVSAAVGISGYSSDVFLHLAAGKHLLTSGALPAGDPFSFTRPGQSWVLHEWLYQLALYLLYAGFGMGGVQLAGAALFVATLSLTKRNCELLGARQVIAWAVTIGLLLCWHPFIGVRPHVLTYLLFAVYLFALLRYRYLRHTNTLYLLPPLMVVWVNSHGGFIVGLVLLAYLLLLQLLETRLRDGRWRVERPLLLTLLATLAASLINPYGYEQWLFPFRLMDQWAMAYVTEWQPPDLHEWENLFYLGVVACLWGASLLWFKEERWYRLVLTLPFVAASLQSLRHIPLAVFLLAPFVASLLEQALVRWQAHRGNAVPGRPLGPREAVFNWLVLACYAGVMVWSYPLYTAWRAADLQQRFPLGATRYLTEHRVEGRMFAPLEYSSYILFARYPAQQLFYDVRIEMYGAELAHHYLTMANALGGWQALFERYAIDYAVVSKRMPLYAALAGCNGFAQRYTDNSSAVFVRAEHTTPLRCD